MKLIDPHLIDLASGTSQRIEISRFNRVGGILVSVLRGQIDIWFGDFTGGSLPNVPHLHFFATGTVEYAPLPEGIQTITVAGRGSVTPVQGCVMLVDGQR